MRIEADTRRMRPEDTVFFERYMREPDKLEFSVMGRGKRARDILAAEKNNALCFTWNDEPVILYGIHRRTVLGREGNPWMCATDKIRDMGVARTMLKHGKQELERIADGYEILWNYVHTGNAIAMRWLQWMGFAFPGDVIHIDHHPFQFFKMEADYVRTGDHARAGHGR